MTDIGICQRALSKLNVEDILPADALTNPLDKVSRACAAFYADARRQVFRLASWTCITKRLLLCRNTWTALAVHALGDLVIGATGVYLCTTAGTSGASAPTWPTSGTVADGTVTWTFQYTTARALQANNYTGKLYQFAVPLDFLRKIAVTDASGTDQAFRFEAGVLFSDASEIVLVYVYDSITPDEWDPLLEAAVVLMLASEIAYPITGTHENEVAFAQAARGLAREAELNTLREKRQGPKPSDPWMAELWPERT